MCGGGGGSTQKESAAEKALAVRAKNRLDEWSTDGYKQAELDQISQANVDVSGALKGKANADIEQASQGLGGIPGVTGLSKAIGAIRSAKQGSRFDAVEAAQALQTQGKVNAMKVGQDIAAQNDFSMRSAAERGALKAKTDLQNKVMLSQARGAAIGSVIQGAGAGYMMRDKMTKSDVTASVYDKSAQRTDGMYSNPEWAVA